MIEALSFWNILIHYRNQLLLICDKECLTKDVFFRWLGFLLGFFNTFAFGNMLVPLSGFFEGFFVFFLVSTSSAFFLFCRNRNQFL